MSQQTQRDGKRPDEDLPLADQVRRWDQIELNRRNMLAAMAAAGLGIGYAAGRAGDLEGSVDDDLLLGALSTSLTTLKSKDTYFSGPTSAFDSAQLAAGQLAVVPDDFGMAVKGEDGTMEVPGMGAADNKAKPSHFESLSTEVLNNARVFADAYGGATGYDKIQAAIDDAPTGATVVIPAKGPDTGDVWLTNGSALSIPSNITIDARGATIKKDTSQGEHGFATNSDSAGGNSDITIIGGDWDGDRTSTQTVSDYGFNFYNVDRLKMERINVKNCGFFAIVISAVTNAEFKDISFWPETPKDGMKVMGSCENVAVKGIRGSTKDNLFSIAPDDFSSNISAFGESGDIRNVTVEDIYIEQAAADEACEFRIVGSSTVVAEGIVIRGLHYKAHASSTTNAMAIRTLDENAANMSGDGQLNLDDIHIEDVSTEQNSGPRLIDIQGSDIESVEIENVVIPTGCDLNAAINFDGTVATARVNGVRTFSTSRCVNVASAVTKLTISNLHHTPAIQAVEINADCPDVRITDSQMLGANNFFAGTVGTNTNVHIDGLEMDYDTADDFSVMAPEAELNSVKIQNTICRNGRIVKNNVRGSEDWHLENVVVESGKRIADISSLATGVRFALHDVTFRSASLEPFFLSGCTVKFVGSNWNNETASVDFNFDSSPTIKVKHPDIVHDVTALSTTTFDHLIHDGTGAGEQGRAFRLSGGWFYENGVTESANAETPQGTYPAGQIVYFTDSGDGSGSGTYIIDDGGVPQGPL